MSSKRILKAALVCAVLAAGCAGDPEVKIVPETQVVISTSGDDRITISDSDGIRNVVGLQRIPVGTEYRDQPIDFQFDQTGALRYDIKVGDAFKAPGTVLHVEVTDMNGNQSFHFIRSTPQGFQTGTFAKNG
ncbi:MAG: hypothetical protein KC897_06515 [Candidatus Omnitrophica bacterium]|nr:hypothetical protein [Candidatus Omnitrophota bacterium]MCB9720290.1 hypothetical protein [Candidatus Omnitrophota bacterium]